MHPSQIERFSLDSLANATDLPDLLAVACAPRHGGRDSLFALACVNRAFRDACRPRTRSFAQEVTRRFRLWMWACQLPDATMRAWPKLQPGQVLFQFSELTEDRDPDWEGVFGAAFVSHGPWHAHGEGTLQARSWKAAVAVRKVLMRHRQRMHAELGGEGALDDVIKWPPLSTTRDILRMHMESAVERAVGSSRAKKLAEGLQLVKGRLEARLSADFSLSAALIAHIARNACMCCSGSAVRVLDCLGCPIRCEGPRSLEVNGHGALYCGKDCFNAHTVNLPVGMLGQSAIVHRAQTMELRLHKCASLDLLHENYFKILAEFAGPGGPGICTLEHAYVNGFCVRRRTLLFSNMHAPRESALEHALGVRQRRAMLRELEHCLAEMRAQSIQAEDAACAAHLRALDNRLKDCGVPQLDELRRTFPDLESSLVFRRRLMHARMFDGWPLGSRLEHALMKLGPLDERITGGACSEAYSWYLGLVRTRDSRPRAPLFCGKLNKMQVAVFHLWRDLLKAHTGLRALPGPGLSLVPEQFEVAALHVFERIGSSDWDLELKWRPQALEAPVTGNPELLKKQELAWAIRCTKSGLLLEGAADTLTLEPGSGLAWTRLLRHAFSAMPDSWAAVHFPASDLPINTWKAAWDPTDFPHELYEERDSYSPETTRHPAYQVLDHLRHAVSLSAMFPLTRGPALLMLCAHAEIVVGLLRDHKAANHRALTDDEFCDLIVPPPAASPEFAEWKAEHKKLLSLLRDHGAGDPLLAEYCHSDAPLTNTQRAFDACVACVRTLMEIGVPPSQIGRGGRHARLLALMGLAQ
mgnify:CR=1 FL=1